MENHYGLIELVLVFGLVLGVLGWQLVSVRRELKRDREKGSGSDDAPQSRADGA